MKVTLRYEPEDDEAHHLVLRITLTKKYLEGAGSEILTLFMNYFAKKFPDEPALPVDDMYLKVVGGGSIKHEQKVADFIRDGAEIYILETGKNIPI